MIEALVYFGNVAQDKERVSIPDEFIEWVRREQPMGTISRLDEYGDARVGDHGLQQLARELDALAKILRASELEVAVRNTKLPQDPAIRERIVGQIVEARLSSNPKWNVVERLLLLVDSAKAAGAHGAIAFLGD